jgi:hypothetical protein
MLRQAVERLARLLAGAGEGLDDCSAVFAAKSIPNRPPITPMTKFATVAHEVDDLLHVRFNPAGEAVDELTRAPGRAR